MQQKIHVEVACAPVEKHGLKCVTACEDCRGENYNNAEEILEVEEDNFEEGNFDL